MDYDMMEKTNYAESAGLGVPCAPRTFGELYGIVGRLRATRQQIGSMLDRVSLQPPEASAGQKVGGQIEAQRYDASIAAMATELDRIGGLLDQLERHI